jgi:hypothetical protein
VAEALPMTTIINPMASSVSIDKPSSFRIWSLLL